MKIVLKNTAILFLFAFVLGIINTYQKKYEESWMDRLIPSEILAESKKTLDVRKVYEHLDSLPSETKEELQEKNEQLYWSLLVLRLLLFPIFGYVITRVNLKKVIIDNDVLQRS
jgi:hypothetical protein